MDMDLDFDTLDFEGCDICNCDPCMCETIADEDALNKSCSKSFLFE